MSPEPLGRPKTLVRRHVLEVKKETRDWVDDVVEELRSGFLLGKTARATGDAVGGMLSNPAGVALLTGGVIAGLTAVVGRDAIDDIIAYFGSVQTLFNAETDEEKKAAASSMAIAMRSLIDFFSGGISKFFP